MKSQFPLYLTLRADVETAADTLEKSPGDIGAVNLLALKRRAARLSNLLEDYLYCLLALREARSDTLRLASVRAGFQDLVGNVQKGQKLVAPDGGKDSRPPTIETPATCRNRRTGV